MKKSFLTIISAAAVMIAALTINSCTKQDDLKQTTVSKNDEAKIVFNKVTKFIDKVKYIKENPDFKSGEELSVDSALWYLNAGFNYENSKPDDSYNSFYVDSSFVLLAIGQDGMISFDNIVAAYSYIEDTMNIIVNEAPFSEKEAKFTFIDIKSTDNSGILLKNTTIVGERNSSSGEPPFNEGDDWLYGKNFGKCNAPDEGDAAIEIGDAINANRHLYIDDEGKIVLYSNVVTIENVYANKPEFDNPDDPGTPSNPGAYDNERDYLMYYVHEQNCNSNQNLWDDFSCIYYEDMNFYYYGTTDIIYNKIPSMNQYWPQAYGKTFIHIDTISGTDGTDNNGTYYIHKINKIRYADRWVINIEE